MFFGGLSDVLELVEVVKNVVKNGVFVVCVVGNEGDGDEWIEEFFYFVVYNEVIVVGFVFVVWELLEFFNVNKEIDFVVLGEDILFIFFNKKYGKFIGILMVVFYVSGVFVLIKSYEEELF